MAKHEWEDAPQRFTDIFNYGRRRCRLCGAEQEKISNHVWMRVVSYSWVPRVGRCKPVNGLNDYEIEMAARLRKLMEADSKKAKAEGIKFLNANKARKDRRAMLLKTIKGMHS